MNVLNIPLYYIGFDKSTELESMLKNQGFKNVNHFKAIDGRNFSAKDLVGKNIITLRAYNDLVNGREQHSGMSGLGSVGCAMSHIALWKKCIQDNLPYIIVVENDVEFYHPFTSEDLSNMSTMLAKPKTMIISPNGHLDGSFTGAHFCILSK